MSVTPQQIMTDISNAKNFWMQRNRKFRDWYTILTLVDQLASKGLESYVSNEPQTFYNMAHYLLTKGELSHSTPIENETALELDRRAKINRACIYMWDTIDQGRRDGGNQPFIDELSFYLLLLGWYSIVYMYDNVTGQLKAQVWSPYDTYPVYANNRLSSCVHSYLISETEAMIKAQENGWSYVSKGGNNNVTLDDYFMYDQSYSLYNIIYINNKPVTGLVPRPEMKVMVAPVGGFPDKGSLTSGKSDWKQLAGRGIFEVNSSVVSSFNKWKTMVSQILRDTAQPITQEFSATPQATPEQLRERGAHFHFSPGEQGVQRVPPAAIPIEIQAYLLELRREMQKGSFSDAVYGMMEGQSGYALSLLASSSANQILYPYMDAKHFVIGEGDKFWLSSLKQSGTKFQVSGELIEELTAKEIPDNLPILVQSDVATPKDWLERGTIAGMMDKHVDQDTILTQIYKLQDPQSIKRRKTLDNILNSPMSQQIQMIASFYAHADYLDSRGDSVQANLFRQAAKSLESQMSTPPPGQGKPQEMGRILAQRQAGAPQPVNRVPSQVAPPEARSGFTPAQLRQSLGRGSLIKGGK